MAIIGVTTIERDASQVLNPLGGNVFGAVLQVPYGPTTPIYINSPDLFLDYFTPEGKPFPRYKDYYEALLFLNQSPMYLCRPQGDAIFGGVRVYEDVSGNENQGLDVMSGGNITDPNNYAFSGDSSLFIILGADPSADNNNYSVKIAASSLSEIDDTFDIQLYYKAVLQETFTVSLKNIKDDFGFSLYIEDVIKDRSDIQIIVNPNRDEDAVPLTNSSAVSFTGGVNITSFASTSVTTAAWDNFKAYNKYKVDHILDFSCNSTIGKYVINIATTNFFQHAYVGVPSIKATNPRSTETLNTWQTKVLDYRDVQGVELNVNNDHGSLICNWGRVSDPYNDTTVWISPVSAYVSRKAYTMKNISISQAAVGVLANRGVINDFIELEQDPSSIYKTLDQNQINIITPTPSGNAAWNERTLQVRYSNTSFISHRTYFSYLEYNIEQALFTYVFTDINDGARADVRDLIKGFTDPEIGINAEDIQVRVPKDDALANQRKMKVQVAVIPYAKANEIIFEFIHSRQGVSLSEIF